MTRQMPFLIEPGDKADECHATANLGHPFYFDHPLTHLPGLLLLHMGLTAIGRVADNSGEDPPFRPAQLEVAFRSISSLRQRVHARVILDPTGGLHHCALEQNGRIRAEVVAKAARDRAVPAWEGAAPASDAPPSPAFDAVSRMDVRKSREENVFLGRGSGGNLMTLCSPAADCALAPSICGFYDPVYLTECFLQLCRTDRAAAEESSSGIPPSREILVRIGAVFLRPVRDTEALEIGFRPKTHDSHFDPCPTAMRRTASIFSDGEIVCHFYCDALNVF